MTIRESSRVTPFAQGTYEKKGQKARIGIQEARLRDCKCQEEEESRRRCGLELVDGRCFGS